jgi:hypothetical protein
MTHEHDGELVVFLIGMRINQMWRPRTTDRLSARQGGHWCREYPAFLTTLSIATDWWPDRLPILSA